MLVLAAGACTRATPAEPSVTAPGEATAPTAATGATSAAPPRDWSFLGARDDAQVESLLQEQALVGGYLSARSEDGELVVAEEDVEPLLQYARALLQTQAGEATASILRSDGQRYLRASWLLRRAEEAAQGHASVIRIPLQACIGWGCDVPSEFVAVDCFGPAAFFVVPTGDTSHTSACLQCFSAADDATRAECEGATCNFVAEGWFTGRSEATEADGEPCGTGWEFHIDRVEGVPGEGFEIVVPAGAAPP